MNPYKLSTLKKNYYNTDYVMYDDTFMLLFPNSKLSSDLYKIMQKSTMSTIFSEGHFEQSIDLSNSHSEEEEYALEIINHTAESQSIFTSYYQKICDVFQTIYTTQSFSFEKINTLVYEEVYPHIKNNPYIYLAIADFLVEDADPYLVLFLKNMLFSLSVLYAGDNKIISNTTQIIELSIASLLMDIGVLLIVEQLKKQGTANTINIRNTKIVQLITKITNSILKKSFAHPIVISIINHTHLSFVQASHTLPAPIADLVHYNKILSTYIYLTTPLPSHEHQIPFKALHLIAKNSDKIFPSKYVKDFTKSLGYIPPGSFVELNNGNKAYVIQIHKQQLKAPLVQLLQSSDGTAKNKPIVIGTSVAAFAVKRVLPVEEIGVLQTIKNNLT